MNKKKPGEVLTALYKTIDERKSADPEKSYTARLYAKGTEKLAQKLGEETVEAIIAAVTDNRKDLVDESADMLYHLLVLWADRGVHPDEVLAELEARMGTSGLAEKASRKRDDVR